MSSINLTKLSLKEVVEVTCLNCGKSIGTMTLSTVIEAAMAKGRVWCPECNTAESQGKELCMTCCGNGACPCLVWDDHKTVCGGCGGIGICYQCKGEGYIPKSDDHVPVWSAFPSDTAALYLSCSPKVHKSKPEYDDQKAREQDLASIWEGPDQGAWDA